MTDGFRELLKLAKAARVKTYNELESLVQECNNEVTGADFDSVRQLLKIKLFYFNARTSSYSVRLSFS